MAKIVLTTFGSMGDHNPFLALGLGLRGQGHQVIFAVEHYYQNFFIEQGFETHALSGDGEQFVSQHAVEMFSKNNEMRGIQLLFNEYQAPLLQQRTKELQKICAGADLLVAAATQLVAANIEDTLSIPLVSISLTSGSIPSAYMTQKVLPRQIPSWLIRGYNRLFWLAGKAFVRFRIDPVINKERVALGLSPRRYWLFDGNLSKKLTAVAVSEAFAPPPPDWPDYIKTTGFLFWDKPLSWQEPPELTAFLNDTSQPVVVVSSGSMAEAVPVEFAQFYQTSLEAIRQAGAKALVVGAAEGVLPNPLPANTLAISFAPFSEIYPRCAAVIHHGGIGTTAQGLRAGKPTLVVPWGFDQFYTGSQLANIGAGTTIKRTKYTVAKASKLIRDLLTNPTYAQKAAEIAQHIQHEDGVANLCQEIEALLQKSPVHA